jgi:AcrR family transcriptional regulator
LRETVLDAVGELAAGRPWSQVTMAEVAERAGVSRQTLYNSFGSRQELAQAYVLREAERFVVAVEAAVREAAPDPRAALRAAVEVFLSAAETHPVIRAVASSESGDELLPLLTTRGGPLVGEVTDRLTGIVVESWPGLPRRDAFLVADALVRLAISHAALPGGAPAETAANLARVLGPYLDDLTSALGGDA